MVIRHWRSALLVSAAFVCVGPVSQALAQSAQTTPAATAETDENGTALQKIVVKGKRVSAPAPGSATDTPLATETTAAQIENKQITSISDLGRIAEPGVNFNRNTGGVNIRGLEGSRVLTTVDGIPLTFLSDATRSATGGVDTFDFSSLSAVDVLRGADSSRAGGGALGGVLAVRTLEPEDLIEDGRDWGGIVKYTYDSSDKSSSPSAAIAKRIENTSIMFQGGYKTGKQTDSQGTVDTYGPTRTAPNPSDYDQHNLLFKLRQQLEGGHTIGLTAESYRKDRDTDAKTNQLRVLTSRDQYLPGNYFTNDASARDRVSLDYKFQSESDDSLVDSAWASLYWQDQTRGTGYNGYRSTSVIGPIGRLNDYNERAIGLVGALEKNVDTGYLDHNFVFGFDIAHVTSEQYSSGYDNCPAPLPSGAYPTGYSACANLHTNQADTPKVETGRIGLYLDDKVSFGDTGFSVTPGVRFDWVKHDPKMTDAFADNASNPALPNGFNDTAISPKIRLEQEVNDQVLLYGQWAMGFRAPTAGELFSTFGGPGTYLRIGNPNLKSETSNGFEVGAKLGDDDLGGRVNLFYNRYRNFIDTTSLNAAQAAALGYTLSQYPQGGISTYNNVANAEIFGTEISVHKRFSNGFRALAGLAYAEGNNLDTKTFLQSVAPLKAVVSIGYDTETWGVGLDWTGVKHARGQTIGTATSTSYFSTPGYGIVDLTAWWEPEQIKGLKINAGIYNVFDKTYYDYASVRTGGSQPREYYSEPGRTFKISLTQRF
ncbi:TonB-dependent hemoglobin/transferrin/lactoferrin family receptor [Rhizobium sp. 2MFCol3.1]|uniref:TonB-dependent hemoglobin/transferrin/lactoferrin family receptor n=1 Tax=Rhizobium sp. 2MFCol3.1 TaxID=1246459 RepID=UPI00036BE867|nr:TonB-dependent hemoglobin/transferrin/lactoferrin family receptor [Rhizobium sp. 2MFCol3.1]